jgi:hypothetical protein
VSDDVHGADTLSIRERRRDLPRRRRRRVKHSCLDPQSQAFEDRADIGDGGINEKDFAGTGHDAFLNIIIRVVVLVQLDLVVPRRGVAKIGPKISRGTHCNAPNLSGRRQLTGGPESGGGVGSGI